MKLSSGSILKVFFISAILITPTWTAHAADGAWSGIADATGSGVCEFTKHKILGTLQGNQFTMELRDGWDKVHTISGNVDGGGAFHSNDTFRWPKTTSGWSSKAKKVESDLTGNFYNVGFFGKIKSTSSMEGCVVEIFMLLGEGNEKKSLSEVQGTVNILRMQAGQ